MFFKQCLQFSSIFALFVILSGNASAQKETVVPLTAGQGIPGVDVGLKKKPPGIVIQQGKTDQQGNVSFGVLPKGRYAVTIGFTEIKKSKNYNSAKSNTCLIEISNTSDSELQLLVSKGGIKGIDIIIKKQPTGTISKLSARKGENTTTETDVLEIEFEADGKREVSLRIQSAVAIGPINDPRSKSN
ncbi:MAG: carboxypeptidase regulatory-like domain-containing protein [Acidobacteria bacterium]|nr:carboxypeptidase regulatory-like domain-containing protein [Acidobacteriota bacterium]